MIWYGGDYNPEQWPEEVWDDDVRLMQQGGITLVSLGIFSWAKLEPREGEFDFGWLDRILHKLHGGGIRVDLATATASPPPWLTANYPDVLPVTENGVRLQVGSRQQYCPSSPVLRRLSARLVTKMAERYTGHPALEMWHVNNEYGCHVSHCYCAVSAAAFRTWLRLRYETVDALNASWGTAFWSQQYAEFSEVFPPSAAPSFRNPAQLLDFDRFSSDELLACYRAEVAVLRAATPDIPITTNFMGFFKGADYWKFAQEVDIISDDSYPDPADAEAYIAAAASRDLMRSLGGGRPWLLMEQAPSAVNWRHRNAPKAPGQMAAWSYQAVARGANGILFFQWRQSVAGAEKFHSGMVPHAGTDTRVWREIEQLGSELGQLGSLASAGSAARVAIVFEWDSWWSIEQQAVPTVLSYLQGVLSWHRAFFERHVLVDFVTSTSDLAAYSIVVVPSLFAASSAGLSNLAAFAESGGQLAVTYQTAITDDSARITASGYLGALQQTLGVRIEEFAPLSGGETADIAGICPPAVRIEGQINGYGQLWSEYLQAVDCEVVSSFAGGHVDGWPAITRRSAGAGRGWYVATQLDDDGVRAVADQLLTDAQVAGAIAQPVPGVEAVQRGETLFLINHGDATAEVEGKTIEPKGVRLG